MDSTNGATGAQAAPDTQPPAGAGDAQDAAPQDGQPAMTPEQYERVVAELRKENAAHRTKLKRFEADAAAAEQAKLSDLERATKERDTLATELATLRESHRRTVTEAAITSAALRAGLVNAADAIALIDPARIETGDDGMPQNAQALVDELVKARPYLAAQPAAPKPTGSFDTGAGGRTVQRSFRRSEIKPGTPFFEQHRAEILAASREGRIIEG